MSLNNGFLIFALSFFSALSFAQPQIKFVKPIHDFGFVTEGERPSIEFEFENTGDDTLFLENVKPSCGCTSPYWTKEPIFPGETGTIKISYNSKNRPGPFNKAVTVTANTPENRTIVKIRGVVDKSRIDSSLTEVQKSKLPVLKLDRNEVLLGKIELNKPVIKIIEVTNAGSDTLKIQKVVAGCRCVNFKLNKALGVPPGKSAQLELSFTPREVGEVENRIVIYNNSYQEPVKTISLKANVVEKLVNQSILQNDSGFGF